MIDGEAVVVFIQKAEGCHRREKNEIIFTNPCAIRLRSARIKTEPDFLEIEFSLDTGATISILNSPTLNAIKTHLHQSENE